MSPALSRTELGLAYYHQAVSDWQLFLRLEALEGVALCHRLHYLQMACEKLGKAYLWRDTEAQGLDSSHTGFESFVRMFLRSPVGLAVIGGDRGLVSVAEAAARDIEKLAPAVDRFNTPSNCEYPWQVGERLYVPCHHDFAELKIPRGCGQKGLAFLKLIQTAFDVYQTAQVRAGRR